MRPGTTPPRDGTADLYQRTVHMEVRLRPAATTPIQGYTARPVRVRMLTATGAARLLYVVISGHRPRTEPRRKGLRRALGLQKEHAASPAAELTGIVASSHKTKMTMCTPVRTATSIARIPAAIGSSMRMVAGRIRVPSRRLMLRIRRGPKVPRAYSVPVRAQPTQPALRNGQPSLQRRGNSWIETLRHARRERRGRSSSSGPGSRVESVRGALEEHAGDLSELCQTSLVHIIATIDQSPILTISTDFDSKENP